MWASLYGQYVAEGGTCSPERFAGLDASNRVFIAEPYFRYYEVVSHYRERFGAASVCIGLYEDLVNDPAGFIKSYLAFIGVTPPATKRRESKRINRGLSPAGLRLLRIANRALRSPLNPGAPIPVGNRRARNLLSNLPRPRPGRSTAEELPWGDRVRAGNRRLEEELGLPLAARGYPV